MSTAHARAPFLSPRTASIFLACAALTAACADTSSGDRAVLQPAAGSHHYGTWRPALTDLPKVLPEADAELYRQIYALERQDDWRAADRLMAQLSDRSLVGHILAARYLDNYRASPKEIQSWLAQYADHPDAARIRSLGWRPARAGKTQRRAEADFDNDTENESATTTRRARPPADSGRSALTARGGSVLGQYNFAVKRGNYDAAEAALNRPGADAQLGAARLDSLRADLALANLQSGRFERAYALSRAAMRSRDSVPSVAWVMGLSAYRLGNYADAAEGFEAAAGAGRDDWAPARAAFWAYRANEAAGRREAARRALERAAGYPRTLYGMMARHKLGLRQEFQFGVAAQPDPSALSRIGASAEGRRAFGLIQIGMTSHAGEELLRLYRAGGEANDDTYLAIADRAGLADLAYHVSGQVYTRTGRTYDPGLFPVPDWRPNSGFQLDRALVFAVMRQESAFQPKVVSRARAHGLMQIIPPTAAYVAGDSTLRREKLGRLFDPEFNIELGQRFLRSLLESGGIAGNVAFATAAYNAGEGGLAKWQLRDDALLFMATISYGETRQYVERVLDNLAAYRLRFGQRPAELEALANGQWPIYAAQERGLLVAERRIDRGAIAPAKMSDSGFHLGL